MSAVETLALVLLHVVVAVLALGWGQSHCLNLSPELLDASYACEIAVELGGHIAGLQQLGVEIQRGRQVLVALQPVLLMVPGKRRRLNIMDIFVRKLLKLTPRLRKSSPSRLSPW